MHIKPTFSRKRLLGFVLGAAALAAIPVLAIRPGVADESDANTAPDFTLTDTNGADQTLSKFRGKYVVLEWFNYDCPFVKKHYGSNNMQATQKSVTDGGDVWLSIVSSAPGHQGFYSSAKLNDMAKTRGVASTAILPDPSGRVGRLYHAKTTPHMFVIDPNGKIIYNGAIDNQPTPDPSSIKGATNYVLAALAEAKAGKPVSVSSTQPYGCSVKY